MKGLTSPSDASTDDVREVVGTPRAWSAEAFAALLDVPCPDFTRDSALPLGWQWLYLLDHPRQEDIGIDGHPVRTVFPTPPGPGMRRMWAGGALTSLAPLRVDEEITRRSRIADRTIKEGRSGTLVFVEVSHELHQRGRLAVMERQDIVYRQPPDNVESPSAPPAHDVAPLEPGDWAIPVTPSLLFRFSALTYNAHRIHYDRDYARSVEGYAGLVTHGPLQALAMMEGLRAHAELDTTRSATYEYRLIEPLLEHQGLVVRTHVDVESASSVARAEVRDRSGRRTAEGSYTVH